MKIGKILLAIGFFVLLFMFSSCSNLLQSIYGINSKVLNEDYSKDKVIAMALNENLDIDKLYYLDTAFLKLLSDTTKYSKLQIKNSIQPLQVYFVDSIGNDITYLLNCFYSGFPNINFNKFGELEFFPIQIDTSRLNENILIEDRLFYIKKIKDNGEIDLYKNSKNKVIVFYSDLMGRQKRRLFKQIKDLLGKYDRQKYEVFYVSLDQIFLDKNNEQIEF